MLAARNASDDAGEGPRSAFRWQRRAGFLLSLLIVALCACSVLVLGIRAWSLLEVSPYVHTSGGEASSIYNALKARRGLSLYEWPDRGIYPLAMYNFGFYCSYAFLTTLIPYESPGIVLWLRLTTLLFAAVGCAGFFAAPPVRSARSLSGSAALALMCLGVYAWTSTFLGWWLLTVRPDVAALAFSSLGLAVVLRSKGSARMGTVAGILFFAAWSVRQSCILVFIGTVLAGVIQREWRSSISQLVTFGFLVLVAIAWLGQPYLYNTAYAPTLSPRSFANILRVVPGPAAKGSLFFLGAAAYHLVVMLNGSQSPSGRRTDVYLLTSWWVATLGGILAMARIGASKNYLFESWLVSGLLTAQLIIRLHDSVRRKELLRPRAAVVTVLACGTLILGIDTARILLWNQVGRLTAAPSAEEFKTLRQLALFLRKTEKPAFCRNYMLALPWNTQYPAYIYSDYAFFHRPAAQRGLLRGGGIAGLVRRRHFATMVLSEGDALSNRLYSVAVQAGYGEDGSRFSGYRVLKRGPEVDQRTTRANAPIPVGFEAMR